MAILLSYTLDRALTEINVLQSHAFLIHKPEEPRLLANTDEILEKYAQAKQKVVRVINDFGKSKSFSTDMRNWIAGRKEDEIAYFLNEAGANSLLHSEWKAPKGFHLWMGEKGFIIGIEQSGKGFSVEKSVGESMQKMMHLQGGKGFSFFKECKGAVFFDDPHEARKVFLAIKYF